MSKQQKICPVAPASENTTPKAQILASLAYLASNCALEECQALLQLSFDLCTQCCAHEEDGNCFSQFPPLSPSGDGLSAALAYLCAEAGRNKMGDYVMILDAARTLVDYYLINQWKHALPPVVEH